MERYTNRIQTLCLTLLAVTVGGGSAWAQDNGMSFFITSVGLGTGGNLGSLEGADAHCQRLANEAGAGNRTWRAYLSTTGEDGEEARDRIGEGPWYNAKGLMIAENVTDLHVGNNISRETALTEKGEIVPGRDDEDRVPRVQARHDIITGSLPDGTLTSRAGEINCSNWTSDSIEINAMYGHHDRQGGGSTSWNSAHASRDCSEEGFGAWGGAGLMYCFAADSESD